MIPKNIFIIWTSEKESNDIKNIPMFARHSYEAFRKVNPSCNVMLLDDNHPITHECKEFEKHVAFTMPCQMFNELLRLYAVFRYGGIYVDADCFPVKSFDEQFFQLEDLILPRGDYFAIASRKRDISVLQNMTRYLRSDSFEVKNYFQVPYMPATHDEKFIKEFNFERHEFLKRKLIDGTLEYGERISIIDDPMYYFDHYRINTWTSNYKFYEKI